MINGHIVGHIKAGMAYPFYYLPLARSTDSKISICFSYGECAYFGKRHRYVAFWQLHMRDLFCFCHDISHWKKEAV